MSYRRELWERQNLPKIKGGGRYKRRRKTKGRLVEEFKRKEEGLVPKIDTEVREGADDVELGVPYEITNVEEITTDVQQLSGIRVVLLNAAGDEGTVVLWKRKVTGTGSKLGVFITALGDNTDRWLHKCLIFKQWLPRQREIEVVTSLSPKAPKVVKPKK